MSDAMAPMLSRLYHTAPAVRHVTVTNYAHGVVNGGIIIDMAEWLSRAVQRRDRALSPWIQEHYIEPFQCINRQDGILVRGEEDMFMLVRAHQRYSGLRPMPGKEMPRQLLWVPGLEPVCQVSTRVVREAMSPEERLQMVFDGAKMYENENKRRGQCLGRFKDTYGWERTLWDVARSEIENTEEEKVIEKMEQERNQSEESKVTVTVEMREEAMVDLPIDYDAGINEQESEDVAELESSQDAFLGPIRSTTIPNSDSDFNED